MNDYLIFIALLILTFFQIFRAIEAHREYYDLKREIENDRRRHDVI